MSPSSGSRTTFASQGRSHTPISGNGSNAANVFVLATRLGRIPQEQVRDLYILLEVLVLPRQRMRLTELVTPLKPLEAMAAGTPGTPVLASDIGGHAEMIADGETGLLFKAESRDSLIEQATRVAADAGLRRHLSENARHFVERERTWDRVVARYLPVYDAVASRTGGRV